VKGAAPDLPMTCDPVRNVFDWQEITERSDQLILVNLKLTGVLIDLNDLRDVDDALEFFFMYVDLIKMVCVPPYALPASRLRSVCREALNNLKRIFSAFNGPLPSAWDGHFAPSNIQALREKFNEGRTAALTVRPFKFVVAPTWSQVAVDNPIDFTLVVAPSFSVPNLEVPFTPVTHVPGPVLSMPHVEAPLSYVTIIEVKFDWPTPWTADAPISYILTIPTVPPQPSIPKNRPPLAIPWVPHWRSPPPSVSLGFNPLIWWCCPSQIPPSGFTPPYRADPTPP
jgi:hypothetical protein